VRGVEREYFLWVPASYDAQRAYPIVFRWHGSGGNGTSGGLPIETAAAGDAIIASPSGVRGRWDLAPDGADVELFDTLLKQLGTEYCLDPTRVFSYGFSMGGMMSNLLGCVRSGTLRAVAPVEGAAARAECSGRVAAWIVHTAEDTAVKIERGRAALESYLQRNGCDAAATAATEPAPCVRYDGCAVGFPVVWCQTTGPHNPQGSFSAPGAWQFFKSL
jgi:poly(3-hydroxybutyrate) depolymerase